MLGIGYCLSTGNNWNFQTEWNGLWLTDTPGDMLWVGYNYSRLSRSNTGNNKNQKMFLECFTISITVDFDGIDAPVEGLYVALMEAITKNIS